MVGCYGNSQEDRYYERMLNKYLDETYGDCCEEEEPDWDAIRKQRLEVIKDMEAPDDAA